MKYFQYVLLICFVLILCACEQDEISETPPNIIVFLVDDMGWQDTSVPFYKERTNFNDIYETPNMERLAIEGMKFTQAYATPVCSPSRVSLMTGMNAARHRVTNWTLRKDSIQPMEKNHKILSFPKWNVNGLSPVTGIANSVYASPLAQVLHDVGYFTIHAGKAHLGAIGTPGSDPKNLGFDVNIAGHAAGSPGSYLGAENFGNGKEGRETWAVPGLEKYFGEDIYLTEAITKEALSAIDTALVNRRPFFLYMAHYAVHTPITEDTRFYNKYLEKGLDSVEAKYASMVEGMDKSLGDIMDYLETKEVAEKTIILFMSDNGGLSAHTRAGEPHTHNAPLNSGKGSVYEGGIREPMIVKWPEVVAPNSTSDARVIIEDFYPTILEMAQIEDVQTVQKIDGKSFVSVLEGELKNTGRSLFWHYPNEWGPSGPGIGASSTVRNDAMKLIYYHADSRLELFDLNEDIGETKNLVAEQPEKAKELAKILSDYLREVEAQMPLKKDTGLVVPYPDEVLNFVKQDSLAVENEIQEN